MLETYEPMMSQACYVGYRAALGYYLVPANRNTSLPAVNDPENLHWLTTCSPVVTIYATFFSIKNNQHSAKGDNYFRKKAIPLQARDRLFGLQEVQALRISRQSTREGGKVVSPMHRQHLPSWRYPGTRFNLRAIVRPEVLSQ